MNAATIIKILQVVLIIQQMRQDPSEGISEYLGEAIDGSEKERELIGNLAADIDPAFVKNVFDAIGSIFGGAK